MRMPRSISLCPGFTSVQAANFRVHHLAEGRLYVKLDDLFGIWFETVRVWTFGWKLIFSLSSLLREKRRERQTIGGFTKKYKPQQMKYCPLFTFYRYFKQTQSSNCSNRHSLYIPKAYRYIVRQRAQRDRNPLEKVVEGNNGRSEGRASKLGAILRDFTSLGKIFFNTKTSVKRTSSCLKVTLIFYVS